jgi:hypothetical protein
MLFALNRIDVFRADRSWPESENRFFENTIRSIKNELTDQLREYTEDIEKLEVVKLSTWPALLSLQIQNQDDIYSADACKKADNHFNGLIEDILEDLPRNTQKWNRHEKNRVAQALWQKSYAEEFQQNLRQHINRHFPQLVIPQIIERFNIAAGNAIAEWATQTTTAILNSSEEQYHQEKENILQVSSALKNFLDESDKKLKYPFENLDTKVKQVLAKRSDDDVRNSIKTTIQELQKSEPYNQLGERLYPLYSWDHEFFKGINQVLEAVAKSLETGRVDLDSPNLKKVNVLQVNLLARNLNRLVNLGYTSSAAKEGKTIEARTEVDKNKLKQLNDELNELNIHLNIVLGDVLKQISNQELNRIYETVSELFRCHLYFIEKGANNKAPNISIKFPESELIKVERQIAFTFQFKAGFAITQGTWQEAIEVERKKRTWYTLFLMKKTIYETKYETRSSDNAKLPSVEDLLTGWMQQVQETDSERVNQVAVWILEQIDCLKKNVEQKKDDILDRYKERLDKAYQEITLDYEQRKNVWLPIQKKAQNLSEEFSNLGIILR